MYCLVIKERVQAGPDERLGGLVRTDGEMGRKPYMRACPIEMERKRNRDGLHERIR